MNRIPVEKQEQIIAALIEGCSIRSTERLTGCHRDTIMRFMVRAGEHCDGLMRQSFQDLQLGVVQCDELWTFVGKKDHRLRQDERGNPEMGSVFVFLGLDSDSKLIPAIRVGKRSAATALEFMLDLRERLAGRACIVTDQFEAYRPAIETAFGMNADYAQLVKVPRSGRAPVREAYTPGPHIVRCETVQVQGHVPAKLVSTSFIERANATARLAVKRLNRLTLAYSKKLDNLRAMISLWVCWYNFGLRHRTLGMTPAIAAGIENRFWTVRDLLPSW